jgi:hypothetical protein
MRLGKTILSLLLICFCFNYNFAQLTEDRVSNPYKAKFIYKDIRNFLKAYKMLTKESDTVAIIQSEYLDKGTPGLKEFIVKYNLTAKRIARAIYLYPESYSNIKDKLKALKAGEKKFSKAGYNKLKQLIPSSEFPPTYYLVGGRRGIGSGSIYGPLITIEKDNIDDYYKGDVSTLVHEMVHMQQLRVLNEEYFTIFNEKKSLLSKSVREGVAEFYGQLISDFPSYKEQFLPYLYEREKELWETFKKDAKNKDFGDWYGKPKKEGQPNDLGYLIGLKMAEAYFNKATDKQKASEYLISITDYEIFFEECDYNPE